MSQRKRHKQVARKHGCDGARERIVAWHGWRVCASASPRGGPCHGSSPRVVHAAVRWTGMHRNLFVTLPIVHLFRLGKAERAADESFDPGPEIDVLTLDFLGVLLPHVMLLGSEMPLVGSPTVGGILRDAKRLQQLLQLQEDRVLPPSKHLGSHLPACTKPHISSSSEFSPRRTSSASERQISTSTCAGLKTASTA